MFLSQTSWWAFHSWQPFWRSWIIRVYIFNICKLIILSLSQQILISQNSQQPVMLCLVMSFIESFFCTKNMKQLFSFARCHFGSISPFRHQLLKLWTSSQSISIWKSWRLILLLNLCLLIMNIWWHSFVILLIISDGMCSYFNLYGSHGLHRMWYMTCHTI